MNRACWGNPFSGVIGALSGNVPDMGDYTSAAEIARIGAHFRRGPGAPDGCRMCRRFWGLLAVSGAATGLVLTGYAWILFIFAWLVTMTVAGLALHDRRPLMPPKDVAEPAQDEIPRWARERL